MAVLRRLQIEYRLRGAQGLVRFLASRVIHRKADLVFERKMFRQKIDADDADMLSAVVIDHRNVDSHAVQSIKQQILVGDNEKYRPGLSAGDCLFAGVDSDGRVITYAFVLFKTRYKKVLGLREDVPLISNCFTEPAWRGKRLYPRMLKRVCRDLSEAGHSNISISCEPDNVSSIKGIQRAGFKGVHHVRCTMIMSRIVAFRRVESFSDWEARAKL